MSIKTAITKDRILELFHVDTKAGILRHKRPQGAAKTGGHAGYVTKAGYRVICIDYVDYFEHNLIWFLKTGFWPVPPVEIDHRNLRRDDNRFKNLRLASRSQNNANAGLRKDNKCGVKGVHYDPERKTFNVQVTKDGKTHNVGRFSTLEKAAVAAAETRQRLFGEFARN